MTIRVAINGSGRIGHNPLRTLSASGYRNRTQVVAFNVSLVDLSFPASRDTR